jgi:xyloglucan fucosyltransferase
VAASPLRRLQSFDGEFKESLGNMPRSGAVSVSADGGNVWTPPAYVYLHLAGGYGFHDKLFFCGAHQRLLRGVPWLLVRTDNYVVPGLFLTPPFRDELERMFPEKDAAFHHVGRYLFHPSNAVWHAVTSYYRARLAGSGRRVGVQIRVFHKEQPRQRVLNQVLACVRDEALLLPEANDTSSVLVTSLSSWYLERIRDEFGGGVHQPSHEGGSGGTTRRTTCGRSARCSCSARATCSLPAASPRSATSRRGSPGCAPGSWLGRPCRPKTAGRGSTRRMASVEPCFHTPSAYDCAAGRDVDLDKATPYSRRCVDVRWGIKLVNETSSQW